MKRFVLFCIIPLTIGMFAVGDDVVITSFAGNGMLSWSAPSGSVCTVEWASSLDSTTQWRHSWADLSDISMNDTSAVVHVPMFYRVVAKDVTTPRMYVSAATEVNATVVHVFDLTDNTLVATIDAQGFGPRAIDAHIESRTLYVANADDGTVSVIDAISNTVRTLIAVGDDPGGVHVNPGLGRVYIANDGGSSVSVVDISTHSLLTNIATSPRPQHLVFDNANHRAYLTHFSPPRVSVIDTMSNIVIETIDFDDGLPHGIALIHSTQKLYVSDVESNRVFVVNLVNKELSGVIHVADGPENIVVHPAAQVAYVTCVDGHELSVIDTAQERRTSAITLPGPFYISLNCDMYSAYVTSPDNNALYIINTASHAVVTNIVSHPIAVTFLP